MKAKNNYLDNKQFLQDIIEWKNKLKDNPDERIPDSVGKAILLICKKLGTRDNFSGYSYLEEMEDDAIEDCVNAVKNFDPENYSNPFGYFTRIAWFAFLQRIKEEKRENYIKHKSFQNIHLLDDIEVASDLSDKVIGEFEDLIKKDKKKP